MFLFCFLNELNIYRNHFQLKITSTIIQFEAAVKIISECTFSPNLSQLLVLWLLYFVTQDTVDQKLTN